MRLRGQLAKLPASAEVLIVYPQPDRIEEASHNRDSGPQWRVIASDVGRAIQQNAGAHEARNDWLWFLHADSQLTEETLSALAKFIAADIDRLGYFDLEFINDGPSLMFVNTIGAWLRSHLFDMPFGDQGLVMPRRTFSRLGGFDASVTCGEDHELIWRARHNNIAVKAVDAALLTSARRYAQQGWWKTTRWSVAETWRQARRFSRRREPQ